MNVCCNCLVETTDQSCPNCMMQHTMVPVVVFLDGCHLDELIAARDHWLGLSERFRPSHDAWEQRLLRFDKWIDRVRRARRETQKPAAQVVVSELLDVPLQPE